MESKPQDLPETEITTTPEHNLVLDKPPPDVIASDNVTPILLIDNEFEDKAETTEVPKKNDAQIIDAETKELPQSPNVVANDNTSPVILIDDENESTMENDDDSESNEVVALTLPPIKDPRLQRALAELDKKLHILTTTMRHSDLSSDPNTALHRMLEKNRELSGFKYPETRSVGFIGDSGVGKSSLINSLLDIKGMARSGGGGGACTCVATEFRYVDKDHPDPYTIEATFMNAKERSELLKELLQDYRTWRCDESRENVESADLPEERQRAKVAADRAWQMLEALFKAESKFSQEFLRSESRNAVSSILKKLDQWASGKITDDHCHLIKATDVDHCKSQLDGLTSGSQNDEASGLWLFLKLVRVYLDSPLLKTGVVLADLPGFRDTNQVRVRVTQRYLRDTCDEVFIVSNISRCCSDQSIQDILARNPKHPRIVCTRSEVRSISILNPCYKSTDISPEEYSRKEDDFSIHIREKVKKIEFVQQQKQRAVKERQRAADEDKPRYRDKESLLRLKRLLVRHRNDFVTQKLQAQFEVLGVFCVSNSLYSNSHDDHSEAYIALSGIPELRRHCQRLITDSQMRATSDYLKTKMTIHLGSLRQWAMAASDDLAAIKTAELCLALKNAEAFLKQV
ncbi:uncharacterized protein N7459_001707 [Penicillium hispanicum]|uniref:uncharacterized protein n=1 Tax=Penicillium hispanicum TaxID=1080232 RepID=UPI0025415695|nr:uncharacterized protein N7459_001707 [Penicillium hispanicum]KAJ5595499.1 hypothetical protein N7459_001707 [Penicillium hispanicum]